MKLKNETIEKSKKVPNTEAFVRARMEDVYRTYGSV